MAAGGTPLEEGSYRHPRCSRCQDRPTAKIKIATNLRWITRLRRCKALDDQVIDFAIVLQLDRPDDWEDVARWSVAHANYHRYRYRKDDPLAVRDSLAIINSAGDVAYAYRHALKDAYPRVDDHLKHWWGRG